MPYYWIKNTHRICVHAPNPVILSQILSTLGLLPCLAPIHQAIESPPQVTLYQCKLRGLTHQVQSMWTSPLHVRWRCSKVAYWIGALVPGCSAASADAKVARSGVGRPPRAVTIACLGTPARTSQ